MHGTLLKNNTPPKPGTLILSGYPTSFTNHKYSTSTRYCYPTVVTADRVTQLYPGAHEPIHHPGTNSNFYQCDSRVGTSKNLMSTSSGCPMPKRIHTGSGSSQVLTVNCKFKLTIPCSSLHIWLKCNLLLTVNDPFSLLSVLLCCEVTTSGKCVQLDTMQLDENDAMYIIHVSSVTVKWCKYHRHNKSLHAALQLSTFYPIPQTQYTIYNIQCTMYNVQCTMYNVQCTMHNLQFTMYPTYSCQNWYFWLCHTFKDASNHIAKVHTGNRQI
jgi:hypothetical protein